MKNIYYQLIIYIGKVLVWCEMDKYRKIMVPNNVYKSDINI